MDDLSQQMDELEVLNSIYNTSWKIEEKIESSPCFSIEVNPNVKLYVTLPPKYPSCEPPHYELLAPYLSLETKNKIAREFADIYDNSNGSPVLFQWIEKLKELTQNLLSLQNVKEEVFEDVEVNKTERQNFNIIHGPVIQDRKSVFQGHVCSAFSLKDVQDIKDSLLQNKKIAQATHNIMAYRIMLPKECLLQDCDDDGESHAGGRLLHLLQILNISDVVVIVSRWYGGIHLGPDRFRHINNAAREALKEGQFIT